MSLAPVVLFVYNRPEHTAKTLESLEANQLSAESELIVFADGAKENASQEVVEQIKKTRAVLRKKQWCGKVTINECKVNKGLAQSVIEGVSKVVDEFGKVIVLEDDMVLSPYFLKFMNDALAVYDSNEDVACVSGYIYPVKEKLPQTFFIKGADCWGWATWKNQWTLFEQNGLKLLKEMEEKGLSTAFDFEDAYGYTQMLKDQIEGKNSSWAIRWYASAFLKNKYCLYPGVSLVQNIGVDGSGTHSGISDKWAVNLSQKKITVNVLPVKENTEAKNAIIQYFRNLKKNHRSFVVALMDKVRSIFKNA
ncbi:MAG: glycosyltransferase [Bacteroidetes bacterium]|nr:glycosyltransferase [Bacteroidota bacterium]